MMCFRFPPGKSELRETESAMRASAGSFRAQQLDRALLGNYTRTCSDLFVCAAVCQICGEGSDLTHCLGLAAGRWHSESLLLAKRRSNQPVESTPITRPIRDCPKTKSRVRLSYHADQSFHEGTSRSSRAASPPPRYPPRRSTGRKYRGWTNCADSSQETPPSNKTRD